MSGSYSTSNFLGQGETFEVAAQVGARAKNYQFSVTEPYLFDRPISGGITLFSRKYDYMYSYDQVFYSEVRAGVSVTGGMPLNLISPFARVFTSYAYEVIDTAFDEDLLENATGGNPGDPVFGSLDRGRHIESRVSPTVVYNTVDNPFAPRSGMRITGTFEVAGGLLGGTTDYIRPDAEVILYIPHTRRTAFGLRAQGGLIRQYGATDSLPYYRRFFLGGETQIRGVDIRTVGPHGFAAAGARRRQVPAVQRGVLLRHRQHGARARLPRRGPGLRGGRSVQPPRAAHVQRRRDARDDAGDERAAPVHLRVEPLSRHLPTRPYLQIRRGHDVLTTCRRCKTTRRS